MILCSLSTACDTFSQLLTEGFKIAETEPVEQEMTKQSVAKTDSKLLDRDRVYDRQIQIGKYSSQFKMSLLIQFDLIHTSSEDVRTVNFVLLKKP